MLMPKEKLDCLRDCNGACCQGIYIGTGDKDGAEIMELRGMRAIFNKDAGFYDIFSPPCRFLNPEGRCSVEGMKPKLCKKFEVGGPTCLHMRKLWHPAKGD